jgi:hypothetical protein
MPTGFSFPRSTDPFATSKPLAQTAHTTHAEKFILNYLRTINRPWRASSVAIIMYHVWSVLSLEYVSCSLPWWLLPIDYIHDQFGVSWLNPHHVTSLGLSGEFMTVDLSNADCFACCWAVSLRWPSLKQQPKLTLGNLDFFFVLRVCQWWLQFSMSFQHLEDEWMTMNRKINYSENGGLIRLPQTGILVACVASCRLEVRCYRLIHCC